ncbi:MAG: hypothetical protein WED09_11990 [Homoserinimonas sp.]
MIHIHYTHQDDLIVDVGNGVVVFRKVEAFVEQDDDLNWSEDRESTLLLDIRWNDDQFTYEIVDLRVQVEPGGEPINGALLRALPIQLILKRCVNRAMYLRPEVPGSNLVSMHTKTLEPGLFEQLKAQGPTPETLDWVARIYKNARIKLEPPTQYVAGALEIPHRTASHWVKLARQRGHLSDAAHG